ncbi:50S ribosomal protein L25, partial [bacterium]
ISNLGIGDSIHLRDLKLPEKWRITEDLEEVIVSIVAPKKLEEIEVVEEEEEVKEPEVVKEEEKKEEEEKEEEE